MLYLPDVDGVVRKTALSDGVWVRDRDGAARPLRSLSHLRDAADSTGHAHIAHRGDGDAPARWLRVHADDVAGRRGRARMAAHTPPPHLLTDAAATASTRHSRVDDAAVATLRACGWDPAAVADAHRRVDALSDVVADVDPLATWAGPAALHHVDHRDAVAAATAVAASPPTHRVAQLAHWIASGDTPAWQPPDTPDRAARGWEPTHPDDPRYAAIVVDDAHSPDRDAGALAYSLLPLAPLAAATTAGGEHTPGETVITVHPGALRDPDALHRLAGHLNLRDTIFTAERGTLSRDAAGTRDLHDLHDRRLAAERELAADRDLTPARRAALIDAANELPALRHVRMVADDFAPVSRWRVVGTSIRAPRLPTHSGALDDQYLTHLLPRLTGSLVDDVAAERVRDADRHTETLQRRMWDAFDRGDRRAGRDRQRAVHRYRAARGQFTVTGDVYHVAAVEDLANLADGGVPDHMYFDKADPYWVGVLADVDQRKRGHPYNSFVERDWPDPEEVDRGVPEEYANREVENVTFQRVSALRAPADPAACRRDTHAKRGEGTHPHTCPSETAARMLRHAELWDPDRGWVPFAATTRGDVDDLAARLHTRMTRRLAAANNGDDLPDIRDLGDMVPSQLRHPRR